MTRSALTSLAILSFLVGGIGTAYAAYEISDGSVKALYHLEDTVDSSGSGLNLTNQNTATFDTGKLGDAVYLNGTNLLYTSTTTGLPNGADARGYAFWIYQTTANVAYSVSHGSAATDEAVQVTTDTDTGDDIGIDIYNHGAAGTSDMNANTWELVICNYPGSGTTVTCYVNNGSADPIDLGYTLNTGESTFRIGNAVSGALKLTGRVDELVILNREFTEEERTELWNEGSGQEICVSVGCGGGTPPPATSTTATSTPFENLASLTFYYMIALGVFMTAWLSYHMLSSHKHD